MTILRDISGLLGFRSSSLRSLSARRAVITPAIYLAFGFLVFVLVRNSVYAELRELGPGVAEPGLPGGFLQLNVVQAVLFLALVYVPAVICLSNAIAGDGLGLTLSREEYQTQVSALFPLWGTLFLISAPLQWLAPEFLVFGVFGISIGLLALVLLLAVYSVWAIRGLNSISSVAAVAVFALSWVTLPLFYVLTAFFFALPGFIILWILFLAFQRFRGYAAGRAGERDLQRYLQNLTINPQDSDAQHQLGLIHLQRGNLDPALRHLEKAVGIDSSIAEYHYDLGRVWEARGDWPQALEQYEETYRIDPDFGQGDIFREVGKAYLHTDKLEKASEFLRFFMEIRSSDPEGRYWLAVTLQKLGRLEEMRVQLNTILEQARAHPRFFRKDKRRWVFRARILLRRE